MPTARWNSSSGQACPVCPHSISSTKNYSLLFFRSFSPHIHSHFCRLSNIIITDQTFHNKQGPREAGGKIVYFMYFRLQWRRKWKSGEFAVGSWTTQSVFPQEQAFLVELDFHWFVFFSAPVGGIGKWNGCKSLAKGLFFELPRLKCQ